MAQGRSAQIRLSRILVLVEAELLRPVDVPCNDLLEEAALASVHERGGQLDHPTTLFLPWPGSKRLVARQQLVRDQYARDCPLLLQMSGSTLPCDRPVELPLANVDYLTNLLQRVRVDHERAREPPVGNQQLASSTSRFTLPITDPVRSTPSLVTVQSSLRAAGSAARLHDSPDSIREPSEVV